MYTHVTQKSFHLPKRRNLFQRRSRTHRRRTHKKKSLIYTPTPEHALKRRTYECDLVTRKRDLSLPSSFRGSSFRGSLVQEGSEKSLLRVTRSHSYVRLLSACSGVGVYIKDFHLLYVFCVYESSFRGSLVHTEDVHTDDVHTEDVHTEDVHTEDVHTEVSSFLSSFCVSSSARLPLQHISSLGDVSSFQHTLIERTPPPPGGFPIYYVP